MASLTEFLDRQLSRIPPPFKEGDYWILPRAGNYATVTIESGTTLVLNTIEVEIKEKAQIELPLDAMYLTSLMFSKKPSNVRYRYSDYPSDRGTLKLPNGECISFIHGCPKL